MRPALQNTYTYFITLPDRMYPFACEVEGQWVRGRLSYEQALNRAIDTYGLGHFGYKLSLYRSVFHFIGSVLFIYLAALISKTLWGSDIALYILFCAAIAALTYQEFYLHPKRYGQHIQKSIADWLTWVTPIVIYLFR
jgi:hypothetical protein